MTITTNLPKAPTNAPKNTRSSQYIQVIHPIYSFNDISRKVLRANYPSTLRSRNNPTSNNPNSDTSNSNSLPGNDDIPDINEILEVLISTNLNTSNTFEHDLVDLLVAGCQAINPGEEHVASKFSRVIFTFCSKHMVNLNGKVNGNQIPLDLLVNFLLDAFTKATQSIYVVDILRALSQVLLENGANCQKLHGKILKTLLPVAGCDNLNYEIRRMAINCLGNLCFRSGTKLQGKYKDIYGVLLENLSVQEIRRDDSALLKVISCALRSLQLIINEDKSVLAEPFRPTIEAIKRCIFFNVDELKKSAQNSGGNMRKNSNPASPTYSRHVRTRSLGRTWISSDSELSDGEFTHSRKRHEDSRIRQNALGCLQSIAKSSAKLLYPYWNNFLPDTHASLSTAPSLLTLILYENTLAIRIAACSAITAMIDGSKQYLAAADDREIKSSFTSLSAKLGAIVRELHAGLLQILAKENQSNILIYLLKCCNVLVNNTTYERLSGGYLSRLYYAIVRFLNNDDVNVKIITMTLISSIVECKSCVEEVDNLLRATIISDGPIRVKQNYGQSFEVINILTFLVKLIGNVSQTTSIRIEAWSVLCACTRSHFVNVSPMWLQITPLIEKDLKAEDASIRTASINFLVEYARELAAACGSRQNDSEEDGVVIQQFQNVVMPEVFQWWNTVLSDHIQITTADTCHAVRALSSDFISFIPANIFASLPSDKKNFCIKTLLGFTKDANANVRAAACRGLGVYILFPELQQDTKFATNMVYSAIEQMSDSTLLVRVRSSWALGNFNPENSNVRNTNLNEFLINVMWARIVKAGLNASNDNDKVRPNGVRTLGSIIHVSPTNFLVREERGLIKEVVQVLIKNFENGSLKVRWNACYAAANMLRNPNFPIGSKNNSWSTQLYESLARVVQNSKNFKVRINACLALATPMTREKYGDVTILCKILHAIVSSIENVDNLTNTGFGEVKYQDQLRNQLLATYNHLITIANPGDKKFIDPFIERVNQWSAKRNGQINSLKA
ncbi:10543_t:CDS:10 [Acaulospora morrowiae]|uniref:10543_t:CDS:1 n=1 Tax=Acaulospora morrowiae TaxID=94023 RepID=A0A9N8YWR0_9GLOM|nr:10543_t:CDS:10 [Acaulospora morrowiae]